MKILINLKSDKTKKMIFAFLIACVAVYFVYILITYIMTDKTGEVQLSFKTDETNILSKAAATYSLKDSNGRLIMSSGEETEINPDENQSSDMTADSSAKKEKKLPDGIISTPVRLKTTGGSVGDVKLEFTYDISLMSIDKNSIALVKINSSRTNEEINFKNDTENNKISATADADGTWVLVNKSIFK